MQTTIRIDSAVRNRLETLKQPGESLGDVVERVTAAYNPLAGLGELLAMPEVAAAINADYRASLKTVDRELPQ